MQARESYDDSGTIKIHKNVIASISTLAAGEIEGVKYVGTNSKNGILGLISKKLLSHIKVEIDKNDEVEVEIPLVIKYGHNIPDIANKVQENVRNALEKMTNLSIRDININVQGIEK